MLKDNRDSELVSRRKLTMVGEEVIGLVTPGQQWRGVDTLVKDVLLIYFVHETPPLRVLKIMVLTQKYVKD